jgi:diaminopimelate epimerase
MEMYNNEGSRGEMCGNGIRCVAKYVVEHSIAKGPHLRIETEAGVKDVECVMEGGDVVSVRVDMGPPVLESRAIPTTIETPQVIDHSMTLGGVEYRVTCVSMGNPHAVVFVQDLHRVDLPVVGPAFEHAACFPRRINTHFVRVDSPTHVTMRTWERGSGATRACGTGACAVCIAGVLTKRTQRAITATLPGGELQIEWASDDRVFMAGPAVEVFSGNWIAPG